MGCPDGTEKVEGQGPEKKPGGDFPVTVRRVEF